MAWKEKRDTIVPGLKHRELVIVHGVAELVQLSKTAVGNGLASAESRFRNMLPRCSARGDKKNY